MGSVQIDARIKPGSHIRQGDHLYTVIGPERDSQGAITGRIEVESDRGVWSAYGNGKGYWVHKREAYTATELVTMFTLVLDTSIDHLEAAMREHLRTHPVAELVKTQTGLPQPSRPAKPPQGF